MISYRELLSENEAMKAEVLKAYNSCNKNKKEFLKIIKQNTGLMPKAFKSGYLKDYMDTLVWR